MGTGANLISSNGFFVLHRSLAVSWRKLSRSYLFFQVWQFHDRKIFAHFEFYLDLLKTLMVRNSHDSNPSPELFKNIRMEVVLFHLAGAAVTRGLAIFGLFRDFKCGGGSKSFSKVLAGVGVIHSHHDFHIGIGENLIPKRL